MRSTTHSVLVSLGLALSASTVLAAGTVQVSYVQPEKFMDIGRVQRDREDNMRQLTKHFEELAGRYLADGQKLTIEVLDVDLAGELRPAASAGRDLRVLTGGADWPRITLRYTLESAGKAALSGEEKVADMNYTRRTGTVGADEPLHAEKRMLEDWFEAKFKSGAAR